MPTSLLHNNVTLNFDADYAVGYYCTGDPYIVDPGAGITINSYTPAPTTEASGWAKNGAMVNPTAGTEVEQGFDDTINSAGYNDTLNVGNKGAFTVTAGSTLLVAVSEGTTGNRPQLTNVAIFTVVSEAPAPDSFRPAYCGTDKTVFGNVSDLDYSYLPSLAQPASGANVPSLASVEGNMALPWLEIHTEVGGDYMHPSAHQPSYGRDMCYELNEVFLSLCLDYSNAQKETVYKQLVQYGIDVWGAAKTGAVWINNGGINPGRKLPLLVAGKALGSAEILSYGNAASVSPNGFIFAEDQQTFYIAQAQVDQTVNEFNSVAYTSITYVEDFDTGSSKYVVEFPSAHGISKDTVVLLEGVTPEGLNGYRTVETVVDADTIHIKVLGVEGDIGTAGSGTLKSFYGWSYDNRSDGAPYTSDTLGDAEWGARHSDRPYYDNYNFDTNYRNINGSHFVGTSLSARMMGLVQSWNWYAYHDYVEDRYWPTEQADRANSINEIHLFDADMWDAYAVSYPILPAINVTTPNLSTGDWQAAMDTIKADCDTLNTAAGGGATINASDMTLAGSNENCQGAATTQYNNQQSIETEIGLGSLGLTAPTGGFSQQVAILVANNVILEANV